MTLDRFGDVAETEPRVRRKAWVKSPHTKKICGFVGQEVNRESRAKVYTSLRSDYHFYRKGDGYAISDSILQHCQNLGVSRVLVHEGVTPHDDVYEFRAQDYYDAPFVPDEDLHGGDSDIDDPQRYVPLDAAMNHWPNYAAALFSESFEEACGRIGRGER